MWNVADHYSLVRQFNSKHGVRTVPITPDATIILSGGGNDNREIELWRVQHHDSGDRHTSLQLKCTGTRYTTIYCIAVSSDGQIIACGGSDDSIDLFLMSDKQCIQKISGHTSTVSLLVFSHDNHRLFSSSWDRNVRIWNVNDGSLLKELVGHESYVYNIALNKHL